MHQSENNFRTLWKLMEGHRRRYLNALLAMFCGVGLLYITPVDHPRGDRRRDRSPSHFRHFVGRAFSGESPPGLGHRLDPRTGRRRDGRRHRFAAAFMNLQGRLSGIASESIIRRLRDRLAAHLHARANVLARQNPDRRHRPALHQRRGHRPSVLSRAGHRDRAHMLANRDRISRFFSASTGRWPCAQPPSCR